MGTGSFHHPYFHGKNLTFALLMQSLHNFFPKLCPHPSHAKPMEGGTEPPPVTPETCVFPTGPRVDCGRNCFWSSYRNTCVKRRGGGYCPQNSQNADNKGVPSNIIGNH